MAKKKIKKKKIRIFRFLILLVVLLVISFLVYLLLNSKIKNIIVLGTKYLKDDEIIEKAKLKNYPSFFMTLSYNIKKDIKKIDLVKDVKVRKSFFNVVTLDITEYKVLLKHNDKYIIENNKEIRIDDTIGVPRLVNDVEEKKLKQLINALCEVDIKVLEQISEIEYVPNTYDKDRFLLYMDDGNSVYLTLTKFEKINYYDKVLTQLEGKKGFLYLDSGNHFKIKE